MAINTAPHIHNLVMCANVFVRKEDKYLVLRRSPLKKYLPNTIHPIGGKIDSNENPYQGALRELYEEAGITVNNLRLEAVVMEISPVRGEDENWLIFHFSGDYQSGELSTTEEGTFELLSVEELLQEKLFPSVKITIDHILNPNTGTVFATIYYDGNGDMTSSELSTCCI